MGAQPGAVRLLGQLPAYQGLIYFTLHELPDRPSSVHMPSPTLYRLDPKHPESFQRLSRLPPGVEGPGFFDGGYYYFVVRAARENWLGWSARDLSVQPVTRLFRYRIP